MIDRYIKEYSPDDLIGGYLYLNKPQGEILHKNIYKLEFKNLYSYIIVGLYDNGYLKHKDIESFNLSEEIFKLKLYLTQPEPHDDAWKFFVNGFYGKLYNYYSRQIPMISGYMYLFYEELRQQTHNILSIDTDTIWYKDSLPQELFNELGLPYRIIPIDYFYLIEFKYKRYIEVCNGELKTKGIERKSGMSKEHQECLAKVKGLIREDKINQILDEN